MENAASGLSIVRSRHTCFSMTCAPQTPPQHPQAIPSSDPTVPPAHRTAPSYPRSLPHSYPHTAPDTGCSISEAPPARFPVSGTPQAPPDLFLRCHSAGHNHRLTFTRRVLDQRNIHQLKGRDFVELHIQILQEIDRRPVKRRRQKNPHRPPCTYPAAPAAIPTGYKAAW